MKRKICFITNSSSTSFILSQLKEENSSLKIKMEVEVDLKKYLYLEINTKEEAIKYLLNCGFSKDEPMAINILKEIREGNKILILEVSTEDDNISNLLCENGLPKTGIKGFKIIQGNGGY